MVRFDRSVVRLPLGEVEAHVVSGRSSSGIRYQTAITEEPCALFDGPTRCWREVLIAMLGPPIVTIICWLAGPLLAGTRRKETRKRSWVEFWLMLLAAYLVFAIALLGSHISNENGQADPSSQLVR